MTPKTDSLSPADRAALRKLTPREKLLKAVQNYGGSIARYVVSGDGSDAACADDKYNSLKRLFTAYTRAIRQEARKAKR